MEKAIKERLLGTINTVTELSDYEDSDCIFSQKYPLSPVVMVYVLKRLSEDFQFAITDDFVDALEMCTFAQLETLLEKHSNSLVVAPA